MIAIDERDSRAGIGKRLGGGAPNPARGAGDQDDLVLNGLKVGHGLSRRRFSCRRSPALLVRPGGRPALARPPPPSPVAQPAKLRPRSQDTPQSVAGESSSVR